MEQILTAARPAWHANVKVARITPLSSPRGVTYQVSVELAFAERHVKAYALPPVKTHSEAKVQAFSLRDMLQEFMGGDSVQLYMIPE